MKIGDLYFRMCNSQTVLLFEKQSIFMDRFTIGTIPVELYDRKVIYKFILVSKKGA